MAILLAAGSQGSSAAPLISFQERIDRAQPGDTLTIEGGIYQENIVIDKPLTIDGIGDPVIDGGGKGDVVTITADNVTLSRLVVRGSARAVSQEPAAIKVLDADAPIIKNNRIEASHFGIHITGSRGAVIDGNEIDLGDAPIERRGHAIYLWEVTEGAVHRNTVTNSADGIHLEFSQDNGIAMNAVTGSRYALHFMYSNNNRILDNSFTGNLAGAVLMFSHELLLKGNDLSENRQGATGTGILLKDVDDIWVEGNRILRNKYGLTADGAPQEEGATAVFMRNLFALNDTGLGLMSSAPITFVENAMIENTVQVEALGGDLASDVMSELHPGMADAGPTMRASSDPVWSIGGRGNYWSDYNGYDTDGDGVGDRPYRPEPYFAGALDDHPTLRLFQFTVAQQALDMAAEMFPVYQYSPVIEDRAPLMEPPGPALGDEGGLNGGLLVVSVLFLGLAVALLQVAFDIDPVGWVLRGGKRLIGRAARGAS